MGGVGSRYTADVQGHHDDLWKCGVLKEGLRLWKGELVHLEGPCS